MGNKNIKKEKKKPKASKKGANNKTEPVIASIIKSPESSKEG